MGYTLYWEMMVIPSKHAASKVLAEIPAILKATNHIKLTGRFCHGKEKDQGPVFS